MRSRPSRNSAHRAKRLGGTLYWQMELQEELQLQQVEPAEQDCPSATQSHCPGSDDMLQQVKFVMRAMYGVKRRDCRADFVWNMVDRLVGRLGEG